MTERDSDILKRVFQLPRELSNQHFIHSVLDRINFFIIAHPTLRMFDGVDAKFTSSHKILKNLTIKCYEYAITHPTFDFLKIKSFSSQRQPVFQRSQETMLVQKTNLEH